MPEKVSCITPFSRPTRSRVARKPRLARRRNTTLAKATAGRAANVTSASFGFIQKRMTVIPASVTTSATMATMPAVRSSFSVSTSDVRRVTMRPTGLWSKYLRPSFWRWAKRSVRRSIMIDCPVRIMMMCWM